MLASGLFLGTLTGQSHADPRRDGARCTSAAVSSGAVWKGTYSGVAPGPSAWSGSRCFKTRNQCQAWLNRMTGVYSYSTRTSTCARVG